MENEAVRVEELGFYKIDTYQPRKTKTPQKEVIEQVQGRDLFQTPDYAVDLLIPYIPKRVHSAWEPACGDLKIVKRLLEKTDLDVYASDIRPTNKGSIEIYNFLLGNEENTLPFDVWESFQADNIMIITNPPFSLKRKFYERCREFKVPFALLIPADYSGWIIEACIKGAEKIIPTRRIDYITPSGKSAADGHTADFHSMWLTWGLGLGKTETFVELSLEDKKKNI